MQELKKARASKLVGEGMLSGYGVKGHGQHCNDILDDSKWRDVLE